MTVGDLKKLLNDYNNSASIAIRFEEGMHLTFDKYTYEFSVKGNKEGVDACVSTTVYITLKKR